MARHIITEKELTDWLNKEVWLEGARSFGDGSNKKLDVFIPENTFRVRDQNKTVYIGKDLGAAVVAYNNAP